MLGGNGNCAVSFITGDLLEFPVLNTGERPVPNNVRVIFSYSKIVMDLEKENIFISLQRN
jgi:hypothetical protein